MVASVTRLSPAGRRIAALGAGAALLAPTLVNPHGTGPVLCPLRSLTGVWCPGCGMTRAAGWLARAEWSAAWRFHPWVYALALQAIVAVVAVAVAGPKSAALQRHRRLVAVAIVFNSVGLAALWTYRLTWGSFPTT